MLCGRRAACTWARTFPGGARGRQQFSVRWGTTICVLPLGAEGSGLEQRLAKVHAAGVDVQARVDVVERVHHDVEALPELVVEHVFGVRGDAVLQRAHIERGIDRLGGVGGAL